MARFQEEQRMEEQRAQVAARMKQYEDELARKRMMADHELQRQRNAELAKLQVGVCIKEREVGEVMGVRLAGVIADHELQLQRSAGDGNATREGAFCWRVCTHRWVQMCAQEGAWGKEIGAGAAGVGRVDTGRAGGGGSVPDLQEAEQKLVPSSVACSLSQAKRGLPTPPPYTHLWLPQLQTPARCDTASWHSSTAAKAVRVLTWQWPLTTYYRRRPLRALRRSGCASSSRSRRRGGRRSSTRWVNGARGNIHLEI